MAITAQEIAQYTVGVRSFSPNEIVEADVNKDGVINITDALALAQKTPEKYTLSATTDLTKAIFINNYRFHRYNKYNNSKSAWFFSYANAQGQFTEESLTSSHIPLKQNASVDDVMREIAKEKGKPVIYIPNNTLYTALGNENVSNFLKSWKEAILQKKSSEDAVREAKEKEQVAIKVAYLQSASQQAVDDAVAVTKTAINNLGTGAVPILREIDISNNPNIPGTKANIAKTTGNKLILAAAAVIALVATAAYFLFKGGKKK